MEWTIAAEWRDGMNNSGGMAGLEKSILDPKRWLIACTMDIYSIRVGRIIQKLIRDTT